MNGFGKIVKIFALVSIIIFTTSCQQAADVSNPVAYDKAGIKFDYPKNWSITEDDELKDVRFVLLESPGNAIFIIQVYREEDAALIREYADWFTDEAIKETPVFERTAGDYTKISATIDGETVSGLRQNFSINVFKLAVPHVAEYYRVEKGNKAAFLISQAAEEDLVNEAAGFELIIKSFKLK